MKPSPQAIRVLDYIERNGSVMPIPALQDLGVYRLSARIRELRQAGHNINTEHVEVTTASGNKAYVARYSLSK